MTAAQKRINFKNNGVTPLPTPTPKAKEAPAICSNHCNAGDRLEQYELFTTLCDALVDN